MGVEAYLRKALVDALNEQNKAISAYNSAYQSALRLAFLKNDEAILDELVVKQKLSDKKFDKMHEKMMQEKEQLGMDLAKKHIGIELILNNGNQLILPIKSLVSQKRGSIESAIHSHIVGAFHSSAAKMGKSSLDGFVLLSGESVDPAKLSAMLSNVPVEFKYANITITPYATGLPTKPDAVATDFTSRAVILPVWQSSIDYGLIPVVKSVRKFFPSYREPFQLKIPFGPPLTVHVTSKTEDNSGNYIMGVGKDNQLEGIFNILGITTKDEFEVVSIVPKSVYELRVHKHKPSSESK